MQGINNSGCIVDTTIRESIAFLHRKSVIQNLPERLQ